MVMVARCGMRLTAASVVLSKEKKSSLFSRKSSSIIITIIGMLVVTASNRSGMGVTGSTKSTPAAPRDRDDD